MRRDESDGSTRILVVEDDRALRLGDLRRKLADAGASPVTHTVRGVGHVLRGP
jgi:AmiR/NasT family two-component response regulator